MIEGKKRSERDYRALDILSASDLRVYATDGRKEFYKRAILKKKKEDRDSRAILIGSASHCLLLERENFEEKFYMSICSEEPTGNMKKFVDNLYKYTILNTNEEGEVTADFEDMAKWAYRDAGIKKPNLEGILDKFKDKDPEMYYKEQRECLANNKTLLCIEDRNISEKVVETIKNHEHTRHLFQESSEKEVQIDDFQIDGLGLKAMLDDIEIDEDTVTGTDLKVVYDNEGFLTEYFLKRRADIQAYVYTEALKHKFPGYKIAPFRFVVADSTNFNAPLIYTVSQQTLDSAYTGFEKNGKHYKGVRDIVEEIKWHTSTSQWTMTKEAFDKCGLLTI